MAHFYDYTTRRQYRRHLGIATNIHFANKQINELFNKIKIRVIAYPALYGDVIRL